MLLTKYQELAKRTLKDLGSQQKNMLHMKMGLITEVGELLDALKKHIAYGKELDIVNLMEEWGDAMWYIANYRTLEGKELTFEEHSIFDVYFYLSSKNNPDFNWYENAANVFCRQRSFEETVDILWGFGKNIGDREEMLRMNIEKLRKRYPEKYTDEQAIVRDVDAEREILEKNKNQDQ